MLRLQICGFRTLARDERGTGLIEMAMLLPFLAVLMVGVIDFSMGFARRAELHQAVHRSMERVSANPLYADKETGEVDYEFLKQDVAQAANVAATDVTVTNWLECNGVEQPEYSGTCPPNVPMARYLQLRVDTTFDPMFSFGPVGGSGRVGADGTVPMFAEAAVRIQ